MCGLAGYGLHERGATPERERVAAMIRTLVHRGPDGEGMAVRGPLAAGFRRLAIIDVEGGAQPIFNESGDVAVLCNGEIYNFRELQAELRGRGHRLRTRSDAETLLHLYEEEGEAAVTRLVGMFAFCLLDWRDAERPRVVLGRDRIGIKPLYYAETEEGLFWASEAKAILAADAVGRSMRAEGLLDYLVQGFSSGPDSVWRGIRRLPPAHTLSWQPGAAARVRRYWDLPLDGPRAAASSAELLEEIDARVADHMVADVPLGAFLSGGIDSAAIVASMAAASPAPVVACSIGFRDRRYDELDMARLSARRFGVVQHTHVLDADPGAALAELAWHFDEPLADPSAIPTHALSLLAREHVAVALAGDGGDEVFAGYRRYVLDVAEHRARRSLGNAGCRFAGWIGGWYPRLDWAPRPLRAGGVLRNLAEHPARAYWHSVTQMARGDALALLAPELRQALAAYDPFDAFREHYERPRCEDPLYRAQYADFHGILPDRILTKTDRASMAVSLEVRVPFLDHRLVERFVHLPAAQKVRGGRGKHALRESMRGRLPAQVLDGSKKGFDPPLDGWLRHQLRPAVEDAVESLPTDWFDRGELRRLLAEHDNRWRDHSAALWSLLVLEQWRRRHGVIELAPPA